MIVMDELSDGICILQLGKTIYVESTNILARPYLSYCV